MPNLLVFCHILLLILCTLVDGKSLPMTSSSYCHEDGCPHYFTVAKGRDYELRCYERSVLLSVTEGGPFNSDAFVGDALPFWRLQKYISNFNRTERVSLMSSLIIYSYDEHRTERSMSVLVPDRLMKKIAPSKDSKVNIVYRRPFCAYVFTFDGWVGHSFTIKEREKHFRKTLNENKVGSDCYSKFYIFTRYNQLNVPLQTINEIWFVVKLELSPFQTKANGTQAVITRPREQLPTDWTPIHQNEKAK